MSSGSWNKVVAICNRSGIETHDVEEGTPQLDKPAIEALMRFWKETDSSGRHHVLWVFMKGIVPKTESAAVGRWLGECFASDHDSHSRQDIVTAWYNCRGLAVRENADVLIPLIRDPRHGEWRSALCDILLKTKDPRAADVLAGVLDDEVVAITALECLGKLRARQHLAKIKTFLRHPDSKTRRAAKNALKKLGCPVETPPAPVHLVKDKKKLPAGMEEWSANLDIEDVSPTLEKLAKSIDEGFGRNELAEVVGVVEEMRHDQTKAFRFPIKMESKQSELWLVIFMDDIDSPDLAIHANAELIERFRESVDAKKE